MDHATLQPRDSTATNREQQAPAMRLLDPAAPRVAVIGASAGGVEALVNVARSLPASMPVAILVVLHMPSGASSRLPEIIGRAGPLPATAARDGQRLRAGRIMVAPPDWHLHITDDRVFLRDGARENGFRPAIDPLFRSAARALGPRAIGVLLSGTLDDGVAGLAAIQAMGGATVVQDPTDAIAGALPEAALEVLVPDHVEPAHRIGPILASWAERPLQAELPETDPTTEALLADPQDLPAEGVDLSCPDCGGALQGIAAGSLPRYRCRVGHVFSPASLLDGKSTELEAALWAAVRTLEESATISRRLAERSRAGGAVAAARRFEARQEDAARRADVVRQAIETFDGGEPVNESTEAALARSDG
jgi:two-component system, chemotaxis family, protein-glutamate methylesterase/glutaminase